MSADLIEVRLAGQAAPMCGVIAFDGRVLELFGFSREAALRMHVSHIESISVSFEKKGLTTMPHLKAVGRDGALGFAQMFEPSDVERAELERLVAAIEAAIAGRGAPA